MRTYIELISALATVTGSEMSVAEVPFNRTTAAADPNQNTTTTTCMLDDLTDVYFRQELAIIPTTIILSLSVLTYGLRIIARLLTKQRIWWDDTLMGIGLLLSFEPAICQYLCNYTPPPFPP